MADPIGALRATLSMDSAQFQTGLKQAQTGMQRFGALARKAAIITAGAMTTAGVAVAASMKKTLGAADDMSKAAQAIGIPTEELSRLKYAADLSGLSFESLTKGVTKLSSNMYDAMSGVGEGAKAFEALGINVADTDGNLRSSSDVLADLADAFAAMPDGVEKAALSADIFGRSMGEKFIPLLNGGSDALKDLMDEADTFGAVFSTQMGKDAELFNDNIARLGGTFAAMSATITSEALPTLVQFSEWLVANGPAIAEFIGKAITGFGEFVASLGPHIDRVIKGFNRVVFAANAIGEMFASIPERARQDIEAIKALVTGMADFFRELPAQFKQIGVDIVAGLWAGIQERWQTLVNGFKTLVDKLPGFAKERLGIQSPSTVFAEIGRNIMAGLQGGMEDAGQTALKPLEDFTTDARSEFASFFTDVLTGAEDFGEALRKTLGNVLGNVGGNLLDAGINSVLGSFKIPGFAGGTNYAPGGLAIVGERGPELLELPRGSRVTPNGEFGFQERGRVDVVLTLNDDMLDARVIGASSQVADVKIARNNSIRDQRRRRQ